MIKIENGCYKNLNGMWTYPHTDVSGPRLLTFTAAEGEVPEIGDFITEGRLKKREGYQIENEGKMKWPGSTEEQYVQFGKLYEK